MWCDLGDHVQRQIYFRGAYEPIESYLVKHLLQPGMVVVDAGANVGQYTIIAAMEVGRQGQVHAFEPVPKNFHRLTHHVVENGLDTHVRMNMAALWNRPDTVTLQLGPDVVGNDALYTIGVSSTPTDTVTAPALRLDDYVTEKQLERVDFIKMDVEGAEWFALQGATAVLSRWHPTLLVEVNRHTCSGLGYDPERIWELLEPYGYTMWAIGDSPQKCRRLSNLAGIDLANIIFHMNPLPRSLTSGWSYKSVLRFHRRVEMKH
jgi:FkbM family methyltransferase